MQVEVTKIFPEYGKQAWDGEGKVLEGVGRTVRFSGEWKKMQDIENVLLYGTRPVIVDVPVEDIL